MPIYKFFCETCDNEIERLQSYDSLPPTCCNRRMKRGFGNIAQVNFGAMTPTLRALGGGSVPFTNRALETERDYRNRRAAVDFETRGIQ